MLWMGLVKPFYNKYQTGGLQHLTASQIRTEVGEEMFASCFKFALVRDPLRRLVSQFKSMRRRSDLRQFIGLGDDYDFSAYLDRIVTRQHVQWTPQAEFLTGSDGAILVDRVFKLEDVARDKGPLLQALGLADTVVLPRANATDDIPTPVLTQAESTRVREMFARDYEMFGYA